MLQKLRESVLQSSSQFFFGCLYHVVRSASVADIFLHHLSIFHCLSEFWRSRFVDRTCTMYLPKEVDSSEGKREVSCMES